MKARTIVVAIAAAVGSASCADRAENPQAPPASTFARMADDATDVPFSHVSSGGPALGLRTIASGLVSPVAMKEAPDGSGRLFVVEQTGTMRVIDPRTGLRDGAFLDVSDRLVNMGMLNAGYDERGLLGLAFHPDFATNGRFFIYYSAPPRSGEFDNTSTVAEYEVDPTDPSAEPVEVAVILEEDQPQSNHEAGTLEFGPDGMLYVSIGDGGGANDVGPGHVEDWYEANRGGNGQDITENLLGNILRLDVSTSGSYAVPGDNPFVGTDALPEIYAYGFRNPYRFSFDPGGEHALLVGDAGQGMAEEVSVVTSGGNYGWNVMEGFYCFNAADNHDPLEECPETVEGDHPDAGAPLLTPAIAYPNHANPLVDDGLGVVVVGGYVYRGDLLPQLDGRYVFGDFSENFGPTGRVFVAQPRLGRAGQPMAAPWNFQEAKFPGEPGGTLGRFLKSFAQDLEGEVYLLASRMLGPTGTTGEVLMLTDPAGRR